MSGNQVNKKYVLTYEADVKSYVDGTEKISVATRRMAVNSKQSAAEVEAAVAASGLKNVRVYEETATTLARSVQQQLASNKKLVDSHKSTSSQVIAANDATFKKVQSNARSHRAIMQSAGYQMQDVLVQAGQNANGWMILSQQGSQFASSFGAGGAVAGALISVIGLLGMMATAGGEAADQLESVDENFKKMSDSAKALAFDESVRQLAEEEKALKDLETQMDAATAAYEKHKKARQAGVFGDLGEQDAQAKAELTAVQEATVAYEKQQKVVEDLQAKKLMLGSDPFPDIGQSKVFTAEYKNRLAQLNEMTKSMEKQTRTFEEEYDYRKGIIDSFVLTEEEAAKHYGALEAWKTQELQKEADKRLKIQQGYIDQRLSADIKAENARKRALESDLGSLEGSIPEPDYTKYEAEVARHVEFERKAAELMAQTNQWDLTERTRINKAMELEETRHTARLKAIRDEELKQQTEQIMKGIEAEVKAENTRKDALSRTVTSVERSIPAPNYDEYESELARHKAFQEQYAQAIRKTNEWDLEERTRLNNAKELEETRHAEAMNRIVTEAMEQQVEAQLNGFAQLAGTLAGAAEEGSAAYKILFSVQQAFAIANGTMQAFSTAQTAYATAYQAAALANAGSPIAHTVALTEAQGAYATSLALGLANVGATAGVAFAGAFDKGGMIPQGQFGIVSEFDKELVNGVMVMGQQGGTRVTSREDTARMLEGDSSNIVNQYIQQGGEMQPSQQQGGNQVIINQYNSISGYGDKALESALATAAETGAKKGSDDAYRRVSQDFKDGKGIRQQLKRSTGM